MTCKIKKYTFFKIGVNDTGAVAAAVSDDDDNDDGNDKMNERFSSQRGKVEKQRKGMTYR